MSDLDPAASPVPDTLLAGLEVAVPLRIQELRLMTPPDRHATLQAWRAGAADAIGSRGDALQFGGKKGAAASVFNDLARGLAVLAHAPGGVLFAGLHWCLEHPWGNAADTVTGLACTQGWAPPPMRAQRQTETVAVSGVL